MLRAGDSEIGAGLRQPGSHTTRARDDYQVPGECRRWIARCLNVGTRYRVIREEDVRQAFEEAAAGKPVILSITNHDFRDMAPDVDGFRKLLETVARDFPQVPFFYSEALGAMRSALDIVPQPPCELECTIETVNDSAAVLTVSSKTPTFGPQPWLALKTSGGKYHFDNFDIDIPFHRWQYVFDQETFALSSLSAIGVAANNAYGTTTCRAGRSDHANQYNETLESSRREICRSRGIALKSDPANSRCAK